MSFFTLKTPLPKILGHHGHFLKAMGGALFHDKNLIISSLGSLGGPVLKIAQLSIMIPGLLPDYYKKLCEDILKHPRILPPREIQKIIEEDVDRIDIVTAIDSVHGIPGHSKGKNNHLFLEEHPMAWASLSQVHRCVYNGDIYGCKIQYPLLSHYLKTDEKYLQTLGLIYSGFMPALHYKKILQEFSKGWEKELDYKRERRFMALFQYFLQEEPYIHVPKPLSSLCSSRVLFMEWLWGKPLGEAVLLSQEQRNNLGLLIFTAWMKPLFFHGCLHGDPHRENLTWFIDEKNNMNINLLDFGSGVVLGKKFIGEFCQLFYALKYNDDQGEKKIYETWGISPLTPKVLAFLHEWCLILFSPFFSDSRTGYRLINDEDFLKGRDLCLFYHRELAREKTHLFLPWPVLLLNRLGVVLGSLIHSLEAEQPWGLLFQEYHRDFYVKK